MTGALSLSRWVVIAAGAAVALVLAATLLWLGEGLPVEAATVSVWLRR